MGTADYALPADYDRLFTLENEDRHSQLMYVPVDKYDPLPVATSSGVPVVYTIDRSNISLYPIPDAAYNLALRYFRAPATLVNPTDVPEIPVHDHDLLITYALARCFERENDYQAAQYFQGKFETDRAKSKGQAQHTTDDASQPIQVSGPWSDDSVVLAGRWRA
jgi:hypothetical protein